MARFQGREFDGHERERGTVEKLSAGRRPVKLAAGGVTSPGWQWVWGGGGVWRGSGVNGLYRSGALVNATRRQALASSPVIQSRLLVAPGLDARRAAADLGADHQVHSTPWVT